MLAFPDAEVSRIEILEDRTIQGALPYPTLDSLVDSFSFAVGPSFARFAGSFCAPSRSHSLVFVR
jgi:hypothetical protein